MTYSKMRSIGDLIGDGKLATHQEEEIVVDEFAKTVINKVFKELSLILPAWQYAWKSDDPQNPDKVLNAAKLQWTKAFIENNICTVEQISHGFAKARKYESDFVPSCGKFVSWCTPSPEDLGYPSEQRALRDCISYRNAKKIGIKTIERPWLTELCSRVDWFLMNSASNQMEHKKAEAHFKAQYLDFVNSDYREPEESTEPRLETASVVVDRMSPEQLESRKKRGLDAVKSMRKDLAKANRAKQTIKKG